MTSESDRGGARRRGGRGSGPYGLIRPPSMPDVDDRMTELLRTLGRLEFMLAPQIKALIYPDMGARTMYRHLAHLLAHELIWRMPVNLERRAERVRDGRPVPPPRSPAAYGLSVAGKALLEALEVEHDQRSLDGLKARDARGRRPAPSTMAHDLQTSWWCASAILAARRHRHCQRIFVQVEYVVSREQRIDAVLILRFDWSAARVRPAVYRTPWFDGTPRRASEVEVRLALEVDRGTEPLTVLLGKADRYRQLTATGVYGQVFGGPVLPVFIVPNKTRAAQIGREWRDGWPGGWGVVAVDRAAEHPRYGCLWGNYRALIGGQPFALLTELAQEGAQVRPRQAATLAEWGRDSDPA